MNLPLDINLLDLGLGLVMLLFTLRGAARGFVVEIAGLVNLFAGLWLASRFYTELGQSLTPYIKDPVWANMVAFAAILCAVLVCISALVALLRKFFAMTFTAWLDHACGAAAGFAKGAVLCAIVAALLLHFIPHAPFVEGSQVIPYLTALSIQVIGLLPLDLLHI